MKKIILKTMAILVLSAFTNYNYGQTKKTNNMDSKEQIIKVITDFIEGADSQDIDRLSSSLHLKFTNVQNGYFGKPGVHIINRKSYIDHVKTGKFGGVKREKEIHFINVNGNIAMVHASLTNPDLKFESYISLVKEQNYWKIIIHFPKLELIAQPK